MTAFAMCAGENTQAGRHLDHLGEARVDLVGPDWLSTYEATGRALRHLRDTGDLTRGIRTIIALHVIFAWNRLGLSATTQAVLARAAKQAVFGPDQLDSPTPALPPACPARESA